MDVSCPGCGSRDVEHTRPGRARALGEWLTGGGPWRPPQLTCGHCGIVSGVAVSFGPRRAPAPVRLLRAVRDRRTMIPSPAVYLGSALIGVVLGVVGQWLLGLPWWAVAVLVVAGVAGFFWSTAFWGDSGREPLRTELLRALSPRRAAELDRRELAERFRLAAFPLYGLPSSWAGPRYLGPWAGGWSRQGPVSEELSLGHGDPLAEHGPHLTVTVSAAEQDRRLLAERLWMETTGDFAAVRRRPDPDWTTGVISVAGRRVAVERLADGRHWVAVGAVGGHLLTLSGRDMSIEPIVLVQISDLAGYQS